MSIGHSTPLNTAAILPAGMTGHALLRQIQLEERQAAEAAASAKAAEEMERGAARRGEVERLRGDIDMATARYEELAKQVTAVIDELLALDVKLTGYGLHSIVTNDMISINVPSLKNADPWRQKSISTTQGRIFDRNARLAKARRP